MKVTLHIDDGLVNQLLELTGAQTKTEAVNKALADYISMKRKEELLGLSGKLPIDGDWRKLRELEKYES